YRNILNSNRELACWYATGSTDNARQEMAKWVLETADRNNSNPNPYPILKAQSYYPSIVNIDAEHATTGADRNKGGKLGTLTVNISGVGSGAVFSAPSGARIHTGSLTLNITDKDEDRYNFNYRKVQLPYYNDVGEGNYTDNRVVTGWKIISVSGNSTNTFTNNTTYPEGATGKDILSIDDCYNFADRTDTGKDLYGTSGRVFAQGAYYDVPDNVTSITIQPYWAKCTYLSDANYDVTYNNGSTATNVTAMGTRYSNDVAVDINHSSQKVYTSMSNALSNLGRNASHSVYDYAVVFVGNYHLYSGKSSYVGNNYNNNNTNPDLPVTLMSADLDGDNEPDNVFFLQHGKTRIGLCPLRYDFLCVPDIGMAQKADGLTRMPSIGAFWPYGWFETTNTSLLRVQQMEYATTKRVVSPLILQGGIFDQTFVSWQGGESTSKNQTNYIHLGGNVYFTEFSNGSHINNTQFTTHVPISVTGGEYDSFYLSGTSLPTSGNPTEKADNAEGYIDGGKFGEVASGGMRKIDGNVTWIIYNADIENFYGGGINANKPVTGNISTTMRDCHVGTYCGGPKFGNMSNNKTVTSTINGGQFGTFFGAGFGGTALSKQSTQQNNTFNDASQWDTWAGTYDRKYNSSYGIASRYEFNFFQFSGGSDDTQVGQMYVYYASMSLAETKNVTTTMNGSTVTGNFYGGGNLGKVAGNVNSTLTNCTINGNVFGAGFSATIPTVKVMNTGVTDPDPGYDANAGVFTEAGYPSSVTYTWKHAESVTAGNEFDENGGHFILTEEDLDNLGVVTGKVTLNIEGTTTVDGSVYGGGEESGVDGNTEVTVTGGTIGTENATSYGALVGNVYGGGKGTDEDVKAGLVKGNTTVNIGTSSSSTTPIIYHNIYGGGAYGSVGQFDYDENGMPTGRTANTIGGKAIVNILGGRIGKNGKENGMIFGSSRGDVDAPRSIHDKLAWVYETEVNIGTLSASTGPDIRGSIYGGGENGHTWYNAKVNVHSGTIGIAEGSSITDNNGTPDDDSDDITYSGPEYPYRGNVYGGGCGTDKYYENPANETHDGNGQLYNPLAGIVQGNATVNIDGGLVVHNVYGAGAMGSVGTTDNTGAITSGGTTTIAISGGTIGVDGIGNGNVFGAARGDATTTQTDVALVKTTGVTISGGAILGNVYGGGETGDVGTYTTDNVTDANIYPEGSGVCNVTVTGGTIGPENNTNPNRGNVFGAGKGVANSFKCMKAMVYKANVAVSNGTVWGNVYGGGEIGRVENDTKVEIGTESEIADTSKPDIKGSVFGAGKGLDTHGYSALVRGNPVVTVQGSAKVGGSVYGGGEIASVGKHSLVTDGNKDQHPELEVGMPFTLANTNVGVCTVTVKDKAEITGDVFGAGKGVDPTEITNPGRRKPDGTMESYDPSSNAFHIYVQTLALTTETHVSIGGTTEGTATKVLGSVYGGSES
ncbi:MAG: hypothetical protein IK075_02215, partial [Prevotella sp.]|nr:hypothetical protein [Prevotella sp.]